MKEEEMNHKASLHLENGQIIKVTIRHREYKKISIPNPKKPWWSIKSIKTLILTKVGRDYEDRKD